MNAREVALNGVAELEREIAKTLTRNGFNVSRTARELRVSIERVSRIRDAVGFPVFRGSSGPRIDGPREAEWGAVMRVLDETNGNVKRTSRETGVPETTVRRWKQKSGRW